MTIHYDELWKNIIERMFPHFLAFFLPTLYADTDLAMGYEFLDKELQRIKLKGKKGKKFVDKLVTVRLRSGLEKWLLIHIEVQGKHEVNFSQRMFQYFYRLYDKHEIDITALAILTYKANPDDAFQYDVYGTTLTYQYNVARISDYHESELADSTNPFALISLAVQCANQYLDDEEWKFKVKRRLIRMLSDRAYCREEIVELFEFIDDILCLTDTMKNKIIDEEVTTILEEGNPMAYISGFRKRAIAEGKLEGLLEGIQGMLEIKFGDVPKEIFRKMSSISDIAKLETLKETIKKASTIEQIRNVLCDKVNCA